MSNYIYFISSFIIEFIEDAESIDKNDFKHSLCEEEIEVEEANTFMEDLILITSQTIQSTKFSSSKIITLSLTLEVFDVTSSHHWEEQAIDDSFNITNVQSKPASLDAVNSLTNTIYIYRRYR